MKSKISEIPAGVSLSGEELFAKAATLSEILPNADFYLLTEMNTIDFFVRLFAIWLKGGCAVPIDSRSTEFEIQKITQFLDGAHIFVEKITIPDLRPLNVRFDRIFDAQLILFTSGTSGDPKGVRMRVETILARLYDLKRFLPTSEFERTLCLLPTSFGHGLIGNCLYPLSTGAELHLLPKLELSSLSDLGDVIDKRKITFFSTVPSLWNQIAAFAQPPRANTLRRIHCASAPLNDDLIKTMFEWSGCQRIFNVYGLTECLSWISGNELKPFQPESQNVGSGWGCKLILSEDEKEILVESDFLFDGYVHGEKNKSNLLATGDLGVWGVDGSVSLTGRKKNLIVRGGLKVAPEELERLISSYPLVKQCCVFGVRDGLGQEEIAVALIAERKCDREIMEWLQPKISDYKMPRHWFFVQNIPKNRNGKLDRRTLSRAFFPENENNVSP